jgi:hypothetical protein
VEPSVPGELELMNTPIRKHFSTSDWDFYNTGWLLDASDYVDPPASLRFTISTNSALLKQASVGMPLPEGMIETYAQLKASTTSVIRPFIIFRSQKPDGQAGTENSYCIMVSGKVSGSGMPIDRVQLVRDSTIIEEKTLDPPLYPYTWERVRVKFWVYEGVFFVSLEKYSGGGWVKLCPDWSDPVNKYATSSINRVGIAPLATVPSLFDVTKIYRRVS